MQKIYKMLSKNQKILLLLIIASLISFAVRWMSIKDNSIIFWFDQSRDAYVSRQIIENKDLKILGPSASGTNDTVYHGVLYYYFLAPLYYFGGGNPMVPAIVLVFIGSLGVIPLFYFAKSLFNSEKIGWLAVLGYAVSTESIQLSYWLSNPSLAVVPLIIFYWSIWELGFNNKKNFTILLAISLGIVLQSALWLIYLLGPILVAMLYNYHHFSKKSILRDWKNNFLFIVMVLFFVSSIIGGQFMLWKNGVFLSSSSGAKSTLLEASKFIEILIVYVTKFVQSIGPATPRLSLIIALTSIIALFKLKIKQKVFFISWILAPMWLFIVEPRSSIHIFMSLEVAVILLTSTQVFSIWKKNGIVQKIIAVSSICLYVFSNLFALKINKENSSNILSPQKGTNLSDQLEIVDYTYQQSAGKNFSFSSFSNPNGYYITWAYLYDWYGQNKYGYKPTFVGPDQEGLFGEDLLSRNDVSLDSIHYTIIEPNLDTVPAPIIQEFNAEQDRIAPVSDKNMFGSTVVEIRLIN